MMDKLQRMVLIKLIKTQLKVDKFHLITAYFEKSENQMVLEIREDENSNKFKRAKREVTEKDLQDFRDKFGADPFKTRVYIEQNKITLETFSENEQRRFEL
jgi:hypothetical protein